MRPRTARPGGAFARHGNIAIGRAPAGRDRREDSGKPLGNIPAIRELSRGPRVAPFAVAEAADRPVPERHGFHSIGVR
jgi:hypothetical protein